MKLVIGNRRYSSWSLRGYLALAAFDLEFEEVFIPFDEDFSSAIAPYSAAGLVPLIIDNDVTVWDSLAICEYVNEQYLQGKAWPASVAARAEARAVSAEMHSGFIAVRSEMPMNCLASKTLELSADAIAEVQRIDDIWSGLRQRFAAQGDWLFGEFSIADIMFAPVVSRFITYAVDLSAASQAYSATMMAHPAMQAWIEAAKVENIVIDKYEAFGRPR